MSLGTQVCTFRGAVRKRLLWSSERRDLKLPTQIIAVPFPAYVDHCAEAAAGEATVREAKASRLNELCRRSLVSVEKSRSGGGAGISEPAFLHPRG
jgi:hypothetical protein